MSGMDDAIKKMLFDLVDDQERQRDKESRKNLKRQDETMRQLKEANHAEN